VRVLGNDDMYVSGEEMHAYAFRQSRKRLPEKKVSSFPPFPLVIGSDLKWSDFGCRNPSIRHAVTLAFADGL
jgi:hypothetical protein